MPQTTQRPGQILWVTADVAPEHRELIQATGREFQMEVQFCSHNELNDLTTNRRWKLVGLELANQAEDLKRVKGLRDRLPQLPIFVASPDHSIEAMRAVLGSGATDFLSLPLNPAELGKVLFKFTQRTPAAAAGNEVNGEVISVYGARGGLGTTTLTVNLAVKIASLTDAKVGIVDLDLQRGDVGTFLNLTTTQSLASMASTTGEIDAMFLDSVLTRHPSGVFVLPAPTDVEEADLVTREHVVTAIELMRSQYRYSLVDTPRMLTDATLAAFENSERILLLTDLSIPGIRAGQRILDLLLRVDIGSERVDVLLTVPTKSEVKVEDATRAIGKPPFAIIPRDELSATQAMNAGAPLNGTRDSALSQAVVDLASKLTGTGPKQQSGPLLRRLLSLGRSS